MSLTGSCHCGAIRYTLNEPSPTTAMACNCSICRRRGYLLHFTTPDCVTLEADPASVGEYRFNKHVIAHQFCKTCGCAPLGKGTAPDGKEVMVVNLRCTDGIDPGALSITHVDGASF